MPRVGRTMDRKASRSRGPSVEQWNATHVVGIAVRYWSGLREGPGVESRTRSTAWDVCGTPVVLVEGRAGGIALSHVEPVVGGGS